MSNFETVGVIGAGMMGSEIALVFALAGHPTIISDESRAAADRALDRIKNLIDRGCKRKFWSEEAAQTAVSNLRVVGNLDEHGDRDLVIEAVFEDEAIKRDLFTRLNEILPPTAGVASNTSSIPISSLAPALSEERRKRFVGTHFFSPASRMKLAGC